MKEQVRSAICEFVKEYEKQEAISTKWGEPLEHGFEGKISPKSATFDQKRLKSDWSHRHFAYAVGMGTFGINNMLITRYGCCGRYSTIVTNLNVEPDQPVSEEYCLYKKNGSYGICMKNCPI
ncbi:MAG: hypothetical protein PHQ72_08220 [Hespellia sp.]|nr:hypothetical protein [Hespellia sp.]